MRKKIAYEISGGYEVEYESAESIEDQCVSITNTDTDDTMYFPLEVWNEVVDAAQRLYFEIEGVEDDDNS
jgi:hypothetical protein